MLPLPLMCSVAPGSRPWLSCSWHYRLNRHGRQCARQDSWRLFASQPWTVERPGLLRQQLPIFSVELRIIIRNHHASLSPRVLPLLEWCQNGLIERIRDLDTAWCELNGAFVAGLGLLLIFEWTFNSCNARTARDGCCFAAGALVVFSWAWLIAGNVWLFDAESTGSGVVISACKNGGLGNRNVYTFAYVIIIIEDILWLVIFAYVTARTCLQKTFTG